MAQTAGVLLRTQVVTILGVEQKHGTGKTGKPYTIYKVKASDGNQYDTFDAPLYQAAVQAGGAPVVLEYEERRNGEYTNYDLKGVSLAPTGEVPFAPTVVAPVAQPAAPVGVGANGLTFAQENAQAPSTFAQDKDARITRLSAARTAFDYSAANGTPPDYALDLASKIEHFANTGQVVSVIPPGDSPVVPPTQAGALPWDDAA